MLDPVETYEHHVVTVKIHYDEIACNPRTEFENMGTIVGWRDPRHGIGDRELSVDYHTPAEIAAELREDGARLILPVHYFPQGGTLSVSDAGDDDALENCDGVIYVTADVLRHEYGLTRISAKAIQRATRVLRGEIEEYSAYISGQVFGFIVEDEAGSTLTPAGASTSATTAKHARPRPRSTRLNRSPPRHVRHSSSRAAAFRRFRASGLRGRRTQCCFFTRARSRESRHTITRTSAGCSSPAISLALVTLSLLAYKRRSITTVGVALTSRSSHGCWQASVSRSSATCRRFANSFSTQAIRGRGPSIQVSPTRSGSRRR